MEPLEFHEEITLRFKDYPILLEVSVFQKAYESFCSFIRRTPMGDAFLKYFSGMLYSELTRVENTTLYYEVYKLVFMDGSLTNKTFLVIFNHRAQDYPRIQVYLPEPEKTEISKNLIERVLISAAGYLPDLLIKG